VLTTAAGDEQLFRFLRALNARGVTIVLITHKLGNPGRSPDVSVMRRQMVATLPPCREATREHSRS